MNTFGKLAAIMTVLAFISTANAGVLVSDGFEESWTGNYAEGWDNIGYRHGEPSSSKMEQVSSVDLGNETIINPNSGSHFLALSITAAGDPESSTNWWGGVRRTDLPKAALHKSYEPSASVFFYDTGDALPSPQLSAVPSTSSPEDWTDVQFGQRWNQGDNYWFFEAMGAGWTETSVARTLGWQKLEIALSSDGVLSFFINDNLVGTGSGTYEYLTNPWLQTQFDDGKFAESTVYFDSFTVVPEPATMVLLGLGGLTLIRKRRKT